MARKTRVAVLGAGPSGLAALRAFRSAADSISQDHVEVVCFEKQSDWGGIWNYTDRTGVDEYGEPVHTSMYRHLFSNGPKECLEFADYTFEEHFGGQAIASFPPRAVLWDYIQGRVRKANVRHQCRFNTPVRMVNFDEQDQNFTVTVQDMVQDRMYSEIFDYVIVATGHFSVPNLPCFEGLDSFPGRVLHSHDFREAKHYKEQDLLVVGASYSAEDIALQCWKYGAKSVTISYRTEPMGFDWPDNIDERPLLTHVQADGVVHFQDGSAKRFDVIIFCTGYKHHFPFLPDDLRLKTSNRLWPMGLYKGVVWERNPKLFYLGMQDQYYTFNMFDVQAWFARDVILGRISLPSFAIMQDDSQKWREREEALESEHEMIWYQGDYVKDLLGLTNYPKFEVDGVNRAFELWEEQKYENILTYRDQSHTSLITGTKAPKHRVAWVDVEDDSLEAYVANSRC